MVGRDPCLGRTGRSSWCPHLPGASRSASRSGPLSRSGGSWDGGSPVESSLCRAVGTGCGAERLWASVSSQGDGLAGRPGCQVSVMLKG